MRSFALKPAGIGPLVLSVAFVAACGPDAAPEREPAEDPASGAGPPGGAGTGGAGGARGGAPGGGGSGASDAGSPAARGGAGGGAMAAGGAGGGGGAAGAAAGGSGGAGGSLAAADAGRAGADARGAADSPPGAPPPPSGGKGAFLEQNGVVVVEIESLPPGAGWTKKTSYAGYTGTGYYEWTVGGLSSPGKGVMPLEFVIKTPGNYQIVWRNQEGPGPEDQANDSYLRLLTGTEIADAGQNPLGTNWFKTYHPGGKGRWDFGTTAEPKNQHDFRPVRRAYEAGVHRLEIAGRSNGHSIDRIIIFKYEAGQGAQISSAQAQKFTEAPESPRAP